MTDTQKSVPHQSILPAWIRGPQDFFGGLALVVIALFALWASSDLQGMQGFSFGAGTAPRMFGYMLLALGAAIAAIGVFTEGPQLQVYAWRGPMFVMLAILCFAVSIRPMGMIFSAMVSFMVAAIGSHETQWLETFIVGVCLTAFCALLFPYALGLPLQMLPTFMIR
jgi:putative tricarboxylic transport membrane protein